MSINCEEHENLINCVNVFSKIRRHFDDLLDFLNGYNELVKEHYKKLQAFTKKQMIKIDYPINSIEENSDFNLSFITKKLAVVIQSEILAYEQISDGLDGILKNSANFFTDQEKCQSKSIKQFEISKNDLIEKYKKIDRYKNIFFSNAFNSENILVKIQKMKKHNFNQMNEKDYMLNSLNDSLKKTKNSEKEYKDIIKLAKSFEDSFLSGICEAYNVTKIVGKEIIENIKTVTTNAMVLIKNALKLILIEEETYIPILLDCEVKGKFDNFLSKIEIKNENPFKGITPQLYNIVILDKFKKLNQVDINNQEDDNYTSNSYIIMANQDPQLSIDSLTFEDIHQIVKTLYKNITLKDATGYDTVIEGNKILINKICNQLLIKEETNLEQKAIDILKNLLNNKIYRKLFLQKLNDLRSKGVFKIEEKNFKMIAELLNSILNHCNIDDDFYSSKNLIILSQTFYFQKQNSPKIYLQSIIQRNSILQTKDYWEKFISFSISSEIKDSLDCEERNQTGLKESEKESKNKYANIVFAQLLALSDNMIEFGMDKGVGKEIIMPIMRYYNISKENQEIIYMILEKERSPQINIDEYFDFPIIPQKSDDEVEKLNKDNTTLKEAE